MAYSEKTFSVKVGASSVGDFKQISVSTKPSHAKGNISSGENSVGGRRVSADDRDSPELSVCGLVFPTTATSDNLNTEYSMFGGVNSNSGESGKMQTGTGGSPEPAGIGLDEKKRAKPKTFAGKFRSTGECEVTSELAPVLLHCHIYVKNIHGFMQLPSGAIKMVFRINTQKQMTYICTL